MEMVCESGTCRPYRSAGDAGHPSFLKWTRVDMSAIHQSCLLRQLDQQRQQELFCDCSIIVEGQIFRAHRNVLYGSSGYFRMLLSQGARDPLEPVSASFDVFSSDIFSIILDFIYSGHLELNSANVIEVMSAASYLQMNDVISYCKTFIKSFLDISAKEDAEGRYMCMSDSSPLHDRHENIIEPSTMCDVSMSTQTSIWDHLEKEEHKEDIRGAIVSSPQPLGLNQNSSPQPSLESQIEEEQFSPGLSERRGKASRRRTASSRLVTEDTSLIDLQGVVSHCSQKAEELYASLPSIVGVVGVFNKDSTPSMRYKCPFCTHTVKRKADLKRHLRCHTGERPYPCQACSKRFTRLEHLRSHFETIHQARKLVCRKCKRHVTEVNGRVVSEGTRRYRLCDVCIQESGYSELMGDENDEKDELLLGVEEETSDNREMSWVMDDDDLAEDSGTDLIIQEVEDSDEDNIRK